MTPSETFILVSYFFVLSILAVYGWHRYYLVYLYMRHKDSQPAEPAPLNPLPAVTVQLPIYNEMYVADALIDACCRISRPIAWPWCRHGGDTSIRITRCSRKSSRSCSTATSCSSTAAATARGGSSISTAPPASGAVRPSPTPAAGSTIRSPRIS